MRALLVSALLFAPLLLVLVSLATSWEFGEGLDQQLLPFAVPLAFAGIAVVSGAVSLRDLSSSVVPGNIG